MRILVVLAFALFLGQVTGISSAIAGDECGQRCPGDDAAGQCPPGCLSCACCAVPPGLAPQVSRPLAPSPTQAPAHLGPAILPTSLEPGEIFHVPILLA